MTPEKKIQNEILKYLKKLKDNNEPIFYERRQAGGFSYKKGIPDIYVVYNGIHIEIEVKAEKGEPSPLQEKFEQMCKKCNILYLRTKSVEEVSNLINSLKDI